MATNDSFRAVIDKFRQQATSESNKGAKFEHLIQGYLLTDPAYAGLFKNIWLWNEFPAKANFGSKDIGIDLVAQTQLDEFWAIQCKCYQPDTVIDKPAVDSFISCSSKQFTHPESMQTTGFSQRLIISTTNKWGSNAEETIQGQKPPVTRVNLYDLEHAPVDWVKLEQGIFGEKSRTRPKTVREHQKEAINKALDYYKKSERGKMIMACGTGKTFTALRFAEEQTDHAGLILFLVPSISLLGQALREWTGDAIDPINPVCVCSDTGVAKKRTKDEEEDTFSTVDLALPASTDPTRIVKQLQAFTFASKKGLTVIFSTYQSLDAIHKAQQQFCKIDPDRSIFDLIICDEAHRTTGVAITKDDSSHFIKIHDNDFIKARKRLYMTATPRLYTDESKSKAAQNEAILCSMDDPLIYGEEFHRIGFGEAVEKDLLTDYKVLILTISDKDVPPAIQKMVANKESEINADDASKLIGCINALSKQIHGDDGIVREVDPRIMKRAVAFCQTISDSKSITQLFNSTADVYLNSLGHLSQKMVSVSAKHIDGTMNAPTRNQLLDWLKEANDYSNECKILTNVRCLSEGVDVPSLDAVLFLSARNSHVDVVQSVGRVMRKSPGKKYGYIIIPIVVPSDEDPVKALDDNKRYKIVWDVLNALRAHDDRFNATINKIELNKKKPAQILIGKPAGGYSSVQDDGGGPSSIDDEKIRQLSIQFEQLQGAVFAKLVQKVGDRRYWEQWATSVAQIAERQTKRITAIVEENPIHQKEFTKFLTGLQKNINPSITQQQAIEMLSQHTITKPVFEALFEGYSFVKNNPISLTMQKMLNLLEEQALEKDTATLNSFYESVKKRAAGIDNAEGKQRIIIELYDKFFKTAFPKMVEQLGIVYTPVEVVDYIIHEVNHALKREFDCCISDQNVHILDPFTGTGTFITRLLQSGLIKPSDLQRKYSKEIHANEIVLLAYYIAAVNIENAYHDQLPAESSYQAFDGICLTDTFQLGEASLWDCYDEFQRNSERVQKQKITPVKIIIGNPPYSVGQKSANDNAQNLSYPHLDARIAETYVKKTNATNKNSLYDSYIKAFRWASDRIAKKDDGIICFVSNGNWIDSNSSDGFRKCLEEEFSSIYVLNLRGNQRTSGELSRKEGGKIFGSGSRTPIAITLLVKKAKSKGKAKIFYRDIGDYLSREEKLSLLKDMTSAVKTSMVAWRQLKPNEHGDWISQRNNLFSSFIPLGDKDDKKNTNTFFVPFYSNGLKTQRDAWCYNSSKIELENNIKRTLDFYNQQAKEFKAARAKKPDLEAKNFLNYDATRINWTVNLITDAKNGRPLSFSDGKISNSVYRPFFKQKVFYSRSMNERVYQIPKLFPAHDLENMVICLSGAGSTKDMTVLITDLIPDLHFNGDVQAFPLYYYEEKKTAAALFDMVGGNYERKDAITDFALKQAKTLYGKNVTREDIFYYVYGLLHSPDYRKAFANDLKKSLPRLPLIEDIKHFWSFSKAGRELAELHINYEKADPCKQVEISGLESGFFTVEKMRFPQKDKKDIIIFNSKVTLSSIPLRAYDYVINGKSAIEWIMERYQVTVHKESGIKNDPNDWAKEVGNPRYILDLLLSVITVSLKTLDIVESLPRIKFE